MNIHALPGPERAQIQTQAGCNGRCIFCPNEQVLHSGLPMGRMSAELYRKIIDELAETGLERIMLYLQNEPINDRRLPEFVRYLSERIPDTTSLVVSNGTNLDREISEQLIDAGLKRIKVSLQSLDNDTNLQIMGHDADNVVNNVIALRQLISEKRSKLDLRVSMIATTRNSKGIACARRFWKKHEVRLVTSAMENRGGNITDAEFLSGSEMRLRKDCIRPSREMCVLYDGRVVLCCVDWFRSVIVGDLNTQSVREVWNGPELHKIRKGLCYGDTNLLPEICVSCAESATPDKHRRRKKRLWDLCSLKK